MCRCGLAVLLVVGAVLVVPSSVQAGGSCSIGGSGVTYNRSGTAAVFKNLYAAGKMNCPSARYVMNKWLRPAYRRSYGARLPTRFYDGYVTWHCGKITSRRWRCDEYTSYTTFRFTAYIL